MSRMSGGMALMIPCVLFLLNSGAGFAFQVENGTFGESIYFYESVPAHVNPLIQWTFKDVTIAQLIPLGTPTCIGDQYTGRCNLFENGTLRLNNLALADVGNYTMTAQYPNTTLIKKSIYELRVYNVLNTPVLSSNGTSNNLIGGTYVSLHCNASGQTVTTYTFYRGGNIICSEPNVICRDSNLNFQPITGSDSGNYTCNIQNPISYNTSNTLYLNVSDPVSNVKLTSNVTEWVWPGLDSVSLTCSANGTDVTYTWSLQGEPLPLPNHYLSENKKVLTISPVTANDNGTFTCTATNWINSQNSNGVNLKLGSAISAVTLTGNTSETYIWAGEDSVSLHCLADGSNVTVFWKLNGGLISPSSQYQISQGDSPLHSNLLISPVSKTDAGPFTCEASNRLGNKTSNSLSLNLAWKPEGNITCSAEPDTQGVKLGCSWSGGKPEANVSLTFNGKTENGRNNVTSQVSIGDNFQGSDLICNGDQLGRTSKCTRKIGPPLALEHDNSKITDTNVGGNLNLTVTLEPGLPATFTWLHTPSSQSKESIQSREPLVSSTDFSSSYLIRDVTVNDAGKYECIAKNIIGTQSFLFNVKVEEIPSKTGLSGGAIAGIVIGVLAGVALIGIAAFFIVKRKKRSGNNKRISEPDDQPGTTVTYATVQKKNGGVTNNEQEDDVKYAEIKFPNNNSNMATVPPPVETEYSTVKTSIKQ
ncbi:carcinoembryonic antigen-related cell adhesion molecule 1-like isoform X2 [Rana temporaria]|uniref:carcinoembryonic antigen-related cell adhesion molecule 1-like isoform X2 n=1 Tax=Rana temporaria TaxID=8407 RepID=UPI001AAD8736|nr:carcinoembryonic antigen-related cell adhesion molecule 1-like isoform X2 [Rana temporaria]